MPAMRGRNSKVTWPALVFLLMLIAGRFCGRATTSSLFMSVTLTTIVWNGPVKDGENGSSVPVIAKQRPQASPAPAPGGAPKVSWFIAAVNPVAEIPQADITESELCFRFDMEVTDQEHCTQCTR